MTVRRLDTHIGRTPKAEVLTVTPAVAERLLAHNIHNRTIHPSRVRAMSDAMTRGDWMMNGETIKLGTDGRLLDGQHRLSAVVHSGVTVEMLLVRDVDPAAQGTMDIGRARSAGDWLQMHGLQYASATAAIIAKLLEYTEGRVAFNGARLEPETALRIITRHPEIAESARFVAQFNRDIGALSGGPSVYGTAHVIFSAHNRAEANDYIQRVVTGEMVARGDAAFAAREWLLKARSRRDQPSFALCFAVVAYGWNAHTDKRQMSRMSIKPDESGSFLPARIKGDIFRNNPKALQ